MVVGNPDVRCICAKTVRGCGITDVEGGFLSFSATAMQPDKSAGADIQLVLKLGFVAARQLGARDDKC